MLSASELVIHCFIAIVLFPVIVGQLLAGSPPPQGGFLRKYHLAEPKLDLVTNLFVLMLCLMALNRLAQHFDLIGPDLGAGLVPWLGVPFMTLFFIWLALLVSALLKVHRARASE